MKKFFSVALLTAAGVSAQAQTAPVLTASALTVGAKAPDFSAQDVAGQPVTLKKLLKKGPVVPYFYRGQWCPYCNKQLSQLQDSLQILTARGAQVVVVSPETPANVEKTVAKTKASFPIIHDQDLTIMKAYHTAFTVDDAMAQKYQSFGVNLKEANGLNANVLPVPATYVIGQDGKIKYAYFNPDFHHRATVKAVAQALPAPRL